LGAFLRGMIGISTSAWDDAVAAMGAQVAGITICCLVQRIDDIRSPGGYLRTLTAQAQDGKYSISRVVMALIQRPEPVGRKS
jgi:replication initiation protein RepC